MQLQAPEAPRKSSAPPAPDIEVWGFRLSLVRRPRRGSACWAGWHRGLPGPPLGPMSPEYQL
eukprot:7010034-Alexandrium_andersonii.AAC.1